MTLERKPSHLSQIVILCGGRGTRLKPMTDEIPKALVKLNHRPILDYILDFYRAKGFNRFILCVGYKGDMIRNHFFHKPHDMEIQFSDAGESASMLERICAVEDKIDGTFFVSYGDTLIDLDVEGMLAFHKQSKAGATIVSAKIQNPFGLVTFDPRGVATSFVEKPILNYYIGSFVMERSFLEEVTPQMRDAPDGKGLVEFFVSLMNKKQLVVFEHDGKQLTFNTETERQSAEKDIGEFYTVEEKGIESDEYIKK